MDWEKSYDSKGFDEAQAKYDISPLFDYAGKVWKTKGYKVYISGLQRTYDTAMQIFDFGQIAEPSVYELGLSGEDITNGSNTLFKTELLNEVPKRSYKDTNRKASKAIWTARSRIQWYLNNSRQPETRKDTVRRAEELVDLLEERGEDCVLISHEFFLYTLKSVLKNRGFLIERAGSGRIKNWERIKATKEDNF